MSISVASRVGEKWRPSRLARVPAWRAGRSVPRRPNALEAVRLRSERTVGERDRRHGRRLTRGRDRTLLDAGEQAQGTSVSETATRFGIVGERGRPHRPVGPRRTGPDHRDDAVEPTRATVPEHAASLLQLGADRGTEDVAALRRAVAEHHAGVGGKVRLLIARVVNPSKDVVNQGRSVVDRLPEVVNRVAVLMNGRDQAKRSRSPVFS